MQANLVNDHYSSYSRAVGRNFVNLFFPSAEQTPNVGSYTYHIFTINDTIADAHKLLETYFQVFERERQDVLHRFTSFISSYDHWLLPPLLPAPQLPDISVDAVAIATEGGQGKKEEAALCQRQDMKQKQSVTHHLSCIFHTHRMCNRRG